MEIERNPKFGNKGMRASVRKQIETVDEDLEKAFNLIQVLMFFSQKGSINQDLLDDPIFLPSLKQHFNAYIAKRSLEKQNKNTGINLDI